MPVTKKKLRAPPPATVSGRAAALGHVDFSQRTTLPIRDMWSDCMPVVCLVDAYGWDEHDTASIPGGSTPFMSAVQRLGLDPMRYQVVLWDMMQPQDIVRCPSGRMCLKRNCRRGVGCVEKERTLR